jgi:transposase
MKIATVGVDLAKNVFQIHGADAKGKCVISKRLTRRQFLPFFANLPPCLIGLEACGSSNHWARHLLAAGHQVRQISPQYVKPYVKTNKNDANDAEAICEALSRPGMRFVPVKRIDQQDIQAIHRVRERLVHERTALVNQTRGLLREYGIAISLGIRPFRKRIPEVLEDANNELTPLTREIIADQYACLIDLDRRITQYDQRIDTVFRNDDRCQRLTSIDGVGPMTATALVAAIGNAETFRNGRHLAAWLGLVPRQHSSGERQRLLGISKRGNTYLRTLLIHGARSILQRCEARTDARGRWMQALKARRGFNRACVALANKNARILWALLVRQDAYRPAG